MLSSITFRVLFFLTIVAGLSSPAAGQFPKAIEDNSFFLEEAYDQERGIVQHISTGVLFRKPQRDFKFSLTQEWPLFGPTHQISYTLPYSFLNSNMHRGIGDIGVHYRYQLLSGEEWAAIAPRLSFSIPVGDEEHGLGSGVAGWEFNLPVSRRLSEQFVGHANAGATLLPGIVKKIGQGNEVTRTLLSYFAGASIIWLAKPELNVMLEYLVSNTADMDAAGDIVRSTEHFIIPGFRYALDVGDLQIVPGLAFPVAVSKELTRSGVFFYLSFEHPF